MRATVVPGFCTKMFPLRIIGVFSPAVASHVDPLRRLEVSLYYWAVLPGSMILGAMSERLWTCTSDEVLVLLWSLL